VTVSPAEDSLPWERTIQFPERRNRHFCNLSWDHLEDEQGSEGWSKICVVVTFETLSIAEIGRDSVFPEA
jgi:hypothetical protein